MLKITIPENGAEKPHFLLFVRDPVHVTHAEAHGPHTTDPHSDSSYPNIFFKLPTLSTFQNTHIYRRTEHRIMVQVEGL